MNEHLEYYEESDLQEPFPEKDVPDDYFNDDMYDDYVSQSYDNFEDDHDAYTGFASVYDIFMDNIPYEEWTDYLVGLLKQNNVTEGLVLDMGCGTGNVTELLSDHGYDMIGIDNSGDMLMEAQEKLYESGKNILYLNQDMRSFELYGTVAACVSICDSMSYITEFDDLVKVFKLVNNYLDPDGVFIFDYKTRHQYEVSIGNRTIAENREDCSFIWENSFDVQTQINTYEMTFFVEEEEGLFRRYEEVHYQRAWTLSEIKKAAALANLIFVAQYAAFTEEEAQDDTDRCYVILKEFGKRPCQSGDNDRND